MAAEATVLVAGAGPTGLLLAAELHRRGVVCRLIDEHRAPLHWDRATVVHPRSLEIFEPLGFVEPFLAEGVKQKVARIHSAGQLLGEIDLAECGSRYGYNIGISEEVTESHLTDYLHRVGGEVGRGSRLVSLKEAPGGFVAGIEHDDAATEYCAVQWVVGCDGLHSRTRELCGIELIGSDTVEPWAVFDVTLGGWSESYEGNFAYFEAIPVILTALPKQRWRVYLRPSSSDSDLVADTKATLRGYWPELRYDDVANPTRFHCHTKVATKYRSGRILLAGDAAHVCSPSQGHGMNTGLQDAFNLAWKLARVCQGHSTPDLLDSYEPERRPVAETVIASGDAFEHAKNVTDPAERRVRDAELRANFAKPSSRHHEAIAEAELDIHYGHSPIVMGDAHPTLAAGARIPDTIEVRLAGDETGKLHEFAHRAGHTALLVGASHAALTRLEGDVMTQADPSLVEATILLTTGSGHRQASGSLSQAAAEQLGAGEAVLLVIRPDGHVGLRADRNHLEALAAYQSLLARGRS